MKADPENIIEMVNEGMTAKEIKEELGIKSRASLRRMYYDSLVKAGKIKDIMTARKMRKAAPKRRALTIGKRETIILSKALLVDQLGFKEGDKFRVAKRRDRIILNKIE
ncbi:MAG: hypothetical protein ACFFCW_16870 [Candidatus Hodarchaeota archaeon]